MVQCSEPRREVTVTQNVAGRAVDRKYTFDKVSIANGEVYHLNLRCWCDVRLAEIWKIQ